MWDVGINRYFPTKSQARMNSVRNGVVLGSVVIQIREYSGMFATLC
jgi:hypothetical protein